MTVTDFARRFRLTTFVECEPGSAAHAALVTEFEAGLLQFLTLPADPITPASLISALNEHGHAFVRADDASAPGSFEFTELTNDGSRKLVIRLGYGGRGLDTVAVRHADISSATSRSCVAGDVAADVAAEWFADEAVRLREKFSSGADATGDERMHMLLYTLESLVQNGGLASYLEHTAGSEIDDVILALRALGADDLTRTLEGVRDLYVDERAMVADGVNWQRLEEIRERLDDFDDRYAAANDDLALLLFNRRCGVVTATPDTDATDRDASGWFAMQGQALLDRHANYKELQGEARIHRVLFALDLRVRDGGFAEYIRVTAAPEREEAITWLGAIGAFDLAAIVTDALALCPRKPPKQFDPVLDRQFVELDNSYRATHDNIAQLVYELRQNDSAS